MTDPLTRGLLEGLRKAAEEGAPDPPRRNWGRALGTAAAGAAGLGLGTAAGLGLGELADRLHQKGWGVPISPAQARAVLPALGTAAGVAYSLYRAREGAALQDALQGQHRTDDRSG